MMTPAELALVRRAIVAADPRDPFQLSGEELSFFLGLTTDQLRWRMDRGDLTDLKPVKRAVEALAHRVRSVLGPGRYSSTPTKAS